VGASAVSLVLTAAEPACERVAAELFPEARRGVLTRDELRPRAPFAGHLFALMAGLERGACAGLIVPVREVSPSRPAAPPSSPAPAPSGASPGGLLAVADHVNLELRGPLTGRWPAGVPRDFPQVADVYQPALVRACGGPRVYSSGAVVAGVADAGRLTQFEAQAVAGLGVAAVSDTLVPAAIVAAYYGLTLAACGVSQVDDNDEQ
jgi:hypothetical protein